MNSRQFHVVVIITAIIVYSLTAYNSHGYYHPDEHYQIIEFANLKLGINQPQELAWEYKHEIRSTIQPWLCYLMFNIMDFAGIHDPYWLAIGLRLLTMTFALFIITFAVNAFLPAVHNENRKLFLLMSYLLWFLPYINVRFSSESWSGLLLLAGIVLLYTRQLSRKSFFAAGILLGLSFLFRFQTAIASAGLIAWLIFIRRTGPVQIAVLLSGILLAVAGGFLLDSAFYGHYVNTAWNYFHANIIEDVASRFGTTPAYLFLWKTLYLCILPLGLIIGISLIIVLLRHFRHMIIWVIIPFLVVHLIIPHKEVRFLFPLANLLPLLILLGWQSLTIPRYNALRYTGYGIFAVLLLCNITGIVANMSKDAANGRQHITKQIAHMYGTKQPLTLACGAGNDPYRPWPHLNERFYSSPNIDVVNLSLRQAEQVDLLVIRRTDLSDPFYTTIIRGNHLQPFTKSFPNWIEAVRKIYYGNFYKDDVLLLYARPEKQLTWHL